MPPGEQVEISVYPKQRMFIECPKPIRGFTGGRGAGKSTTGAIDLLLKSKPGCLYMVISPSYKMLERATLRTFIEYATKMGVWDADQYRKQERVARCKNGAEYLFCSADDPESLRGPNASGAWLDEVQDTDEQAYRNVRGCLRQHGKMGWVSATFTPASPDHWTSTEFINTTHPDTTEFFRASLSENTFIDPDFYNSQLANFAASPLQLRREVHGECVYLAGADWLPEYFEGVTIATWPRRERGSLLVTALDSSLGKEGKVGDYAAFVTCLWQEGMMYLDADLKAGQDSSIISQTGVELYRTRQPDYFVVEEEMGQHLLIADMHRVADSLGIVMAITPMDTEKINKKVRIRRLTPYVSRRQMRFMDNPGTRMLLDQMRSFPIGEHDDGPDSLEYAVRMLVKATTGQVYPPRACGFTAMGSVV